MVRQDGLPLIVESRDKAIVSLRRLERLPVDEPPNERWLQELLDRAPELLPVREIDERVDPPLFVLGHDVRTSSGVIDNLFLSANGYPVVVETKLWRNPEARRVVVAQLLDYGAALRGWRYPKLDEIARQNRGKSLWELVRPEGFEYREWADRIDANLTHGRMTLLGVGDAIRAETETLVNALGSHPDFHFRLALLELRIFRIDAGSHLVMPTTLVKTAEIERAIVRVEHGAVIAVQAPAEKDSPRRDALSKAALLETLRGQPEGPIAAEVAERLLTLLSRPPLVVTWGSGSFQGKLPDPGGSGQMLSLCVVQDSGTLYTYVPWLQRQLMRLGRGKGEADRISEEHVRVFRDYAAGGAPSDDQYQIPLPALHGKEHEFVNGLLRVAKLIETAATAESASSG